LNGELTLNIAGLLKPWRQGLDPKEIYREVGEYIELLTSVSNEHLRPDGGLTKDHAKALLDAVVRLEKQIERAAEESPEMRIRTRGVDFGWLREECEDAIKAADFLACNDILGLHYDTFPPIKINHAEAVARFQAAGKHLILLKPGQNHLF